MPIIYAVVPCYNEEEVLPTSSRILEKKWRTLMGAGAISPESRIMLVDDGSKDDTWKIISKLTEEKGSIFAGVKLAGN
jgi:glycosyltransferase involved in cell wall biosynthesis